MPASQLYFHQGHQIDSRKMTVEKKTSKKTRIETPHKDSDKKKAGARDISGASAAEVHVSKKKKKKRI